MRSLKSALFSVLVFGSVGAAAVAGCTATTETEDVPPPAAEPDSGDKTTIPPSNGEEPEEELKDAGKKTDSGVKDAGKDAAKDSGPPAPAPGDACATVDQVFKRGCGKCGQQEAICKAKDAGTGGIVSDYGICTGEIGTCEPGKSETCGNCGTRTCSNSCNWNSCTGQPANACPAGTIGHSTAGCTTPNTYIERTCDDKCAWGGFSGTCEAPLLKVPTTVGGTVKAAWNLTANATAKRPSSTTCPATSLYFTAVPVFSIPVKNETGKAVVVQLYNSGNGTPIDTYLYTYNRATAPTTDDEIKACTKAASDCIALNDACGNVASGGSTYQWAGMDDVAIPAGGTILVYTTASSSTSVGEFALNVKTKSIN